MITVEKVVNNLSLNKVNTVLTREPNVYRLTVNQSVLRLQSEFKETRTLTLIRQGIPGIIEIVESPKTLTFESPGGSENIFMFYTDIGLKATKIFSVISTLAPASVTWSLHYGADRSAAGTEIITGGHTTNSTSGELLTTLDQTDIPAGSSIWLTTSGITGIPTQFSLALIFEKL